MTTDSNSRNPAEILHGKTIWAVVPAAGVGKRMQSSIPKQYLPLEGQPVLAHTLNTLLDSPLIAGLAVALGEHDEYWDDIQLNSDKPVLRVPGGEERANSVLNAIDAVLTACAETSKDHGQDLWVMVHDGVRPCLRQSDIEKLVIEAGIDNNGGILARPVRDTMKRQLPATGKSTDNSACIDLTVERNGLWHALTPQFFHAESLRAAISAMLETMPEAITDEASAMEQAGFKPRLVHGFEDNIKITHPDDLRLAGLFLQQIRLQQNG